MLFKGTIATALSGKMGGIVASHNRGGQYFRQHTIPTDPATNLQTIVRANTSQLANAYSTQLSSAQRVAWETYALNVLRPNRLGDLVNIGAIAHYIRSNGVRLQAGLDRVDDAPTVFNVGDVDPTTFLTITADSTTGSLAFADDVDWVDESGSALLLYVSRPVNPTINFFKGPYRFTAAILGDDTTAPTTPAAITLEQIHGAGTLAHAKIAVSRVDGRLSDPFRFNALTE